MLEKTDEPPSAESPAPAPPNAGWFPQGRAGAGLAPRRPERPRPGRRMPEQAEARWRSAERVAAIVADLGGAEALTALAAGMVERHARLEMVDDYLFNNVQRLGPLTGKGRTRAALTAWLAVVDRLQKSAMALGLERKAKPVNPLDAVRRAVEEANRS